MPLWPLLPWCALAPGAHCLLLRLSAGGDREGRSSDTHGAELLTKWTFPPGTMTPATLGLFFYRTKP